MKLNKHKTVEGGFRYEEAISPETLMYFPWGTVAQLNGAATKAKSNLQHTYVKSGAVICYLYCFLDSNQFLAADILQNTDLPDALKLFTTSVRKM